MPDSAELRALVEQGYARIIDIAPILGVTKQRVSQIVADREDFPEGDRASPAVAAQAVSVRRKGTLGIISVQHAQQPAS